MIELRGDFLLFSVPEVHEKAKTIIEFQRTFRIPDYEEDYPLPPGLGPFPVRLVDDFPERAPKSWLKRGGVAIPMYQSEALWLDLRPPSGNYSYPFAVKVGAGKINVLTGEEWTSELNAAPQDYLVVPRQRWLDGYYVDTGQLRQFVAMPLGSGYGAEEQLTGKAEYGGLQLLVYPMKRSVYRQLFEKKWEGRGIDPALRRMASVNGMSLAPGGKTREEVHKDPWGISAWDQTKGNRCFVHIANSLLWREITGETPPTTPPTAKEYNDAGLPWFSTYQDPRETLQGSKKLSALSSVAAKAAEVRQIPLPENRQVKPNRVVELVKGLARNLVREWR